MRQCLSFALSCLLLPIAVGAEEPAERMPRRALPAPCRERVVPSDAAVDARSADARWNRSYTRGFRAVGRGEWNQAEREFCRAIDAARGFGPRDWRFAETLDELGLIYYSLGELDDAEAMQGAAVAELLLALGPQDARPPSVVGEVCNATDLGRYIERLGWVWARQGKEDGVEALRARPYEIFLRDYLPQDAALVARLEGLVSEYLRREDLEAVTTLEAQIAGIREREAGLLASPR